MGLLRFRLGLVHRCVSPGIEHPVGLVLFHGAAAGLSVSQVKLLTAGGHQLYSSGAEAIRACLS